ncbi:MAG: hypothetical protein IT332_08455 [Ardenticatenales bacterium]|nr:hypothetical protein [Ardenticatenales bacterium]
MNPRYAGSCATLAIVILTVSRVNVWAAQGSSSVRLAVTAVDGWQDTAIDLVDGEALEVRYITGTWTINTAGNWFDADGYPGYYPRDVQGACAEAALPDEQNGALIGRIGGGPPFLIGNHKSTVADRAGALLMRMNDADACRSDNGGRVEVLVAHGATTAVPPTASSVETAMPGTAAPRTAVPAPPTPSAMVPAPPPGDAVSTDLPAPPAVAGTSSATRTAEQSGLPSPPPPARLPSTGGSDRTPQQLALVGLLIMVGLGARRWERRRPAQRGS